MSEEPAKNDQDKTNDQDKPETKGARPAPRSRGSQAPAGWVPIVRGTLMIPTKRDKPCYDSPEQARSEAESAGAQAPVMVVAVYD